MSDLKKALNRWDSVAIITAIVVGVGIFRVPAEVAGLLSSGILMLLAWMIGGAISLLGALCYAELAASFPGTGGNYLYFRESYGKPVAFLFGWSELLVIRTGSIAAVAFISAEYLSSLLGVGAGFVRPIAITVILCLSGLNMLGLRLGKKVHNLFTAVNISVLFVLIVLGFLSGKGSISNFGPGGLSWDAGILPFFALALIPILWTYGGWHENTFVAEETRDAGRVLPQALMTAVALVTVLYVAVNALYIYLMPVEKIAASPLIGSDVFHMLLGPPGRRFFEAVVVIASIGAINAMLITGSRITYAVAEDSPLFASMARLGRRFRTPHRAIMINALWASGLVLIGTFGQLLFFTGILAWLFFALAATSIFVLRSKFPGLERPYRVWGYPLVPVLFITVCSALFVNTLLHNPVPSLFGLCILLSGVPVYLVSKGFWREGGGS